MVIFVNIIELNGKYHGHGYEKVNGHFLYAANDGNARQRTG